MQGSRRNRPFTICLDQCAISKLAVIEDHLVREFRETLVDGVLAGRLVCPICAETVAESAACSLAQRVAIHRLHCTLAGDATGGEVLFFKSMWQLIEEETLAMAQSLSRPIVVRLGPWMGVERDALASQVSQIVKDGKAKMQKPGESYPLAPVQGKQKLEYFLKEILREHISHVSRQIGLLLEGRNPEPRDHMGYKVAVYLKNAGATVDQLKKLRTDLRYHRWEQIEVVFLRALLCAQLELEARNPSPRAYDANDEFDVSRLAVGLYAADLILTDQTMARLCRKAKIERYSTTAVFGMSEISGALAYTRKAIMTEPTRGR